MLVSSAGSVVGLDDMEGVLSFDFMFVGLILGDDASA